MTRNKGSNHFVINESIRRKLPIAAECMLSSCSFQKNKGGIKCKLYTWLTIFQVNAYTLLSIN